MSHLSEQVCQLCVDLGSEGGACDVNEGLSIHFPSHLYFLKNSQRFLFCCLKALGNDSWMKTLQQTIKMELWLKKRYLNNSFTRETDMPNTNTL